MTLLFRDFYMFFNERKKANPRLMTWAGQLSYGNENRNIGDGNQIISFPFIFCFTK